MIEKPNPQMPLVTKLELLRVWLNPDHNLLGQGSKPRPPATLQPPWATVWTAPGLQPYTCWDFPDGPEKREARQIGRPWGKLAQLQTVPTGGGGRALGNCTWGATPGGLHPRAGRFSIAVAAEGGASCHLWVCGGGGQRGTASRGL